MHLKTNSPEKITLEDSKSPITGIITLPGVGSALSRKLQEAGFSTLESIATVSIGELMALGGLGEKTAGKIIQAARDKLGYGFVTADVILETRRNMLRATTGADTLDDLLNGGIETGSITELYGEFRTGKTQLAHQLCVTCQLPPALGGFNNDDNNPISCIYIDTEGTFRPERIVSMTTRFGSDLDVQMVLKHIFHGRAYNSDHQMVLVENIIKDAPSKNVKLVIVDSLIAHFRAEFVGRGTLAARQQKLNQHLHSLLKLAEVSNVAVIVTNQVHSQPDMFFGDPTMPVGGHILAHVSHTRIYLRKSKGERRIARIVDSPLLPESETVFAITEEGIGDVH
ncbi:MAG: DNA repair and recombination protein RadA [Candidatus Heimdallarchaeota archaeon]|nr:MAG: DNA repair and recombination protein RadA [Candidatus Heimdallarchaeota archaeon]